MSTYSVLIFDLDGTILDSTGIYSPKLQAQLPKGGPDIIPGAYKTVAKLAKEGYTLAIATSMDHVSLKVTLAHFKLDSLFKYTISADESKPKPNPLMLYMILSKIEFDLKKKISKDECLMIGDAHSDIDMANTFGIDSVQVRTGIFDKKWKKPPTAIIKDITKLPEWLDDRKRMA